MIYTVNCGYVNAFLIVDEEGIVIVDTGIKGSGKRIVDEIHRIGRNPEDIRLIVLTHGHTDHIGGLKEILKVVKVPVVISGIEYDEMLSGEINIKPITFLGKISYKTMTFLSAAGIMSEPIKGELILADQLMLTSYGVGAKVVPCPGHTRGSLAVVTEEGEAIVGDSLMAIMPWSGPQKPMLAWDIGAVRKSMKDLLAKDIKSFHLSHGGRFSRARIIGAVKKL